MNTLKIQIYEYVGPWDETRAVDVVQLLDQHQFVDEIDVRINSYGGVAFEGLTIYNALTQHPARVTATVEGVACSVASVILQAADDRAMARSAQLMIHEPSVFVGGGVDELQSAMQQLSGLRQTIAEIYDARAATENVQMWLDLMAAETWFTADDAVNAGLIDRLVELKNAPAVNRKRAEGEVHLGFRVQTPTTAGLVPVNLALKRPATNSQPDPQPTAEPMADNTNSGFLAKLMTTLGIKAADDFDALDEARTLAQNAARVQTLESELATAKAATEAAAAKLATANQRLEELETAEDERLVQQAVAEFRIPAAEAEQTRKDLAANRAATRDLLTRLPKNLHKPDSTPQPPNGTAAPEEVSITRSQARNAVEYRKAKERAEKTGAQLVIVEDE